MNYCIKFGSLLERATNEHVNLAKKLWKAAKADPKIPVRVAAGNYAGYGKYVARCHKSGVIEFPLGNSFSVLKLVGNEITFRGKQEEYLGTLLHEIGHHVVNTARAKPWRSYPNGGPSTHFKDSWIWICHTGWTHFHEQVPTPEDICLTLKSPDSKQRKAVVDALTMFNPYTAPPMIKTREAKCENCRAPLRNKRRGAKFCNVNCRVAASRKRIAG